MSYSHECGRRVAAAILASFALPLAAQPPAGTPEARVLAAVEAVCGGAEVHADGTDITVPGASLAESSPLVVRGREVGLRRRFAVGGSPDELSLETIDPGGLLRRVRGLYRAPDARGRLVATLMVVADGQCRVQVARRLLYDAEGKAEHLEQLTPALDGVEVREPLNPPVPPADPEAAAGDAGPTVPVAMVDAGVNYLLPEIRDRLARDGDGAILGFDFWDMDARPFDANPVRSPFFPQRHGTRTASLVVREAPVARIVPYRYPRPDMRRMTELVEDAAEAGVVIFNLALGSNRREDWEAFAAAAAAHPGMLFVISAGNNGRDIDSQPVYPAALELDNTLVVSSALPDGRPAQGSNWGRKSVDIMVPAEELLVTDFHGRPRVVSGSSYAAARVAALAACLLAANPDWRAEILKAAILEQTRPSRGDTDEYSLYGLLSDPGARQRGACPALPRRVVESTREVWTREDLAEEGSVPAASSTHELRPTFVVLEGSGWRLEDIRPAAARTVDILGQCGVDVPEITVRVIEAPERMSIFRDDWSTELVEELAPARPAVFFVRDTLQDIPFDAEAIGRSNSRRRRALADTAWIMAGAQDLGIGLAHELYHVLADSGQHDTDPANLMHEQTSGANTILRASQCLRLIRVAEALGNIRPLN